MLEPHHHLAPRCAGLAFLLVAGMATGVSVVAATPTGIEPKALFPEGCFPGDRRDPNIYDLELDTFPAIKPKPDLGYGPRLARMRYPAACDAGNWSKARLRRQTAANLHAHIADGACLTYEEWNARDPFLHDRFTLYLNAYAPIDDMAAALTTTAPAGGGRLRWTAGPADATGLRPLALTRDGKPVDDIHDRWAGLDDDGGLGRFLLCRKAGDIYNPACELHTSFDRARLTLGFARRHLARLNLIDRFARKMLRCALDAPLPPPPRRE